VISTATLELVGVSSGYGDTTVLRDVSLTVPQGAVVALLGANGAGKSTLLRTVSGLIRPTAGHVLLDGVDVTGSRAHQRTGRGLRHIPEGRGVFRSLTVRENLGLQAERGREGEAVERAIAAFPILGQRLKQVAGTLSGGQQQMLAMAGAYVRSPKLILVDEASLGLAPLIVDEIFQFLRGLAESGVSLLVVDQFVVRALEISSYAYVLQRGTVAYAGDPETLLQGSVFEHYIGA
jgi:branched-chain amino acid transport system ATP-binding protein